MQADTSLTHGEIGPIGPADTPTAGGREPWGTVLLLMTVGVLNYFDRMLPGFLAEPIRRDLHLSDTAIGLINGFGFLLVYAVAGIPIARLADKGRHATVISVSLLLWSGMTAVGGLARGGWQLGLTRIGVALGEAGSTPAAHAFVSRNFSAERRTTALSIIALAGPIGTLLALVGGGLLAATVGWRGTMILVGITGMLLAPIAFIMLNRTAPVREQASPSAGQRRELAALLRKRSAWMIVAAASLVATGGYTMNAFGTAYFMRYHGMTIVEAGVQIGIAAGILGMIVLLIAGSLADRLSRRDPRWVLGVVAGTTMAAVLTTATAFLTPDRTVGVTCFALSSAFMNAYVAPSVAALYRLVDPGLRARTSATLLFVTAMAGGVGPLVVGMLSDRLLPDFGDAALGYALLAVPAFNIVAVACYLAATRLYRADMVADNA